MKRIWRHFNSITFSPNFLLYWWDVMKVTIKTELNFEMIIDCVTLRTILTSLLLVISHRGMWFVFNDYIWPIVQSGVPTLPPPNFLPWSPQIIKTPTNLFSIPWALSNASWGQQHKRFLPCNSSADGKVVKFRSLDTQLSSIANSQDTVVD